MVTLKGLPRLLRRCRDSDPDIKTDQDRLATAPPVRANDAVALSNPFDPFVPRAPNPFEPFVYRAGRSGQSSSSAQDRSEGATDTAHTDSADTEGTENTHQGISAFPSAQSTKDHPRPSSPSSHSHRVHSYSYPETYSGQSDSTYPLFYAHHGHPAPGPKRSRLNLRDRDPLPRQRSLTTLEKQLRIGNNHHYPVFRHPVVSDSNSVDRQTRALVSNPIKQQTRAFISNPVNQRPRAYNSNPFGATALVSNSIDQQVQAFEINSVNQKFPALIPSPVERQHPASNQHPPSETICQDPKFSPTMDSNQSNRRLTSDLLAVPPVMAQDRIDGIRNAKEHQELICKDFETDGKGRPPFELVEMIGKGSYGRVYKAKYLEPPLDALEFVAIKIVNTDAQDYRMMAEERDHSLNDFKNELHILKVLSETKAKNINKVFDAFVLHAQLVWVTEYCPGGSIRSMMIAQPKYCLAEKYVVAAAREIAIGLKGIHDAGVIHRDVKAANILIHEDGRLQLCDFGTSIMLVSETDKRSTILGTPHWMPLEMHEAGGKKQAQYRTEVDVWAYGCTIWELVTGTPPNAGKGLNRQLEVSLRRGPPRLTSDEYSTEVKEFLEFILQTDPSMRPSMQEILNHPFLIDSEITHPYSILSALPVALFDFRAAGGQRQSLLHPGGALPPGIDKDLYDREFRESWNFSSTDAFIARHSRVVDLRDLASLAEADETSPPPVSSIKELTPIEKINFDERVRRGAEAMGGLFNESQPEYKYVAKRDFREIKETKRISDLPLRDTTERSTVRDTQIDLGDFDPSHYVGEPANFPVIQLADADTIRANRSNSRLFRDASEEQLTAKPGDLEEFAVSSSGDESKRPPTQEWKFPSFMQPEESEEPAVVPKRATLAWTFPKEALDEEEPVLATRPTLKHAATEPVGLPSEATILGSMLSSSPPTNDFSLDDSVTDREPEVPRPSTASSMSSDADYDPFKFDLDVNDLATSPDLSEAQAFDSEIQQMLADSGYDTYQYSQIAPAPMIAERPLLSERSEALFREYASMAAPGIPQTLDVETPSLGSAGFPAQNMSIAGGLGASVAGAAVISSNAATGRRSNVWVEFPEIVAPSAEAMTQGAPEQVMADELDRLLGDWVTGLEAVGKAFGEMGEEMAWTDEEGGEREDDE